MSSLNEKVAIVTGGSAGIGLAVAQAFIAEGAYVYITGRRSSELEKAKAELGPRVTVVQGDAANLADLDRLYARVAAEKGRVDVVVANAGIVENASIDTLTPEHFDKIFDINARGPVFLVQKMLPLMSRGGSIILVSSSMHVMGIPGHTAYAATKAALRSYARTWAAEFKDRGIRVNTLSPGVTDTPILDSQAPTPEARETLVNNYLSMIPTRRLARADEIASGVLFLASDQSSYMTGADLMIDGGVGQV